MKTDEATKVEIPHPETETAAPILSVSASMALGPLSLQETEGGYK